MTVKSKEWTKEDYDFIREMKYEMSTEDFARHFKVGLGVIFRIMWEMGERSLDGESSLYVEQTRYLNRLERALTWVPPEMPMLKKLSAGGEK